MMNVTRGFGLLEPYLAHLRAEKANQLIPHKLRNGRILDVGCGSYPYFLSHTSFKEKFAIDIQINENIPKGIHWYNLDLNSKPQLPFEDYYFNVVTLLAVVEHLDPNKLSELLFEIYRTLAKDGLLIMTTPAPWSDGLLRLMSRFNLVSKEEIDEHIFVYTLPLLGWHLGKVGFDINKVKFGYFEFRLNMWALANK